MTLACVSFLSIFFTPFLPINLLYPYNSTDSPPSPQYTARARKRAAGSYFSRSSRLPGEQDDPLTSAKVAMARLETTFHETAKTVDRVSKARRATAESVNALGDQVQTFAMAEQYAPLANGFKRLARTIKADADLLAVQVR